jgi:hypothetical protein
MGQYGEVSLHIECEDYKVADKITDTLEEDVKDFIRTEKGKDNFNFSIDEIGGDDTCIEVLISSEKYQNAEWQGEMIKEYLIAKHKDSVTAITGTISTPNTYIFWDKDEE